MQDSQRAELKGAGEVDPKNIGKRDGWGNLPPKERQEVLHGVVAAQPLDSRQLVPLRQRREQQAARHRSAVDEDGTCAADADPARLAHARQSELAQHRQQ